MTDFAKTEILILLDRSGSMGSIVDDTIGGYNTFVEGQQREPGECRLTLVQFDSQGYDRPIDGARIADVPKLTRETYRPRGQTPLLDAMGRAIDELGDRLALMPEAFRPGKVIFVTITDGHENASRKLARWQVFERVRHQTDKYGWQFVYLGANQDAIAVAAGLGIGVNTTMSYDSANIGDTFRATSDYVSRSRGAAGQSTFVSNSFTPQERAQAAGTIVTPNSDSSGGQG